MDIRALVRRTEAKYLCSLASVFSPTFIRRLSDRSLFRQILADSGVLESASKLPTVSDVFDFVYAVLKESYRCEYIYKNAIASKILLGRHSPQTATLLTEVAVSDCKADLVLINGTTVAYEIKTELDSLDRLTSQLHAYRSAFDRVYTVTHERCADRLRQSLPDGVGLLVLTDRYTLTEEQEAKSHSHQIDASVVFDVLRRNEYISIVRRHFGSVPEVPNTKIYSACRDLFLQLDLSVVHAEFAGALKARSATLGDLESVDSAPHSLKLHAVTGELGAWHRPILLTASQEMLS